MIEGHYGGHPRACAWGGLNCQIAAEQCHPLRHAGEARGGARCDHLGVEPVSLMGNTHREGVPISSEAHGHLRHARISCDIGQCFLHNPVGRDFHFQGEPLRLQ